VELVSESSSKAPGTQPDARDRTARAPSTWRRPSEIVQVFVAGFKVRD